MLALWLDFFAAASILRRLRSEDIVDDDDSFLDLVFFGAEESFSLLP